jgi:hypothetical protein
MLIDKNNFIIENFMQSPKIISPTSATGRKKNRQDRNFHLLNSLRTTDSSLKNVLEFGVRTGSTLSIISNYFSDQQVYGFDSFEGLPEPWSKGDHESYDKNAFACEVPNVPANANLIKGWFNESLPIWLETHQDTIKFMHLDADLYSSTKTVLTLCNKFIVKNTIIVFDELYNWDAPEQFTTWETEEFLALHEWICEFDRKIEVISISGYEQCAIKVC